MDEEPHCEIAQLEDDEDHEELMQWDAIIKKMVETANGNNAILAKILKMQPDCILEKIGISKDHIITPPGKASNEEKSDRWREERSDQVQNEVNMSSKYNPPHRKNLDSQFATSHVNPLYDNRKDKNQNNNFDRHFNNDQYARNTGQRTRGILKNNGNIKQPYGVNQNNRTTNQNNLGYVAQNQGMGNQSLRQPMVIERYRQLDFGGIRGYPNPISNDLRNAIMKFSGNGRF